MLALPHMTLFRFSQNLPLKRLYPNNEDLKLALARCAGASAGVLVFVAVLWGPFPASYVFYHFEALNMDTRDERFVSVHEMTRGTQNKHT